MKVILFNEENIKHMARVHGSLNKPRYQDRRLAFAYTKDGRCTVNACVLENRDDGQRFNHYVNVLEWNKGNIIDVTYEDYDNDNWSILTGHTLSLEDLKAEREARIEGNE